MQSYDKKGTPIIIQSNNITNSNTSIGSSSHNQNNSITSYKEYQSYTPISVFQIFMTGKSINC